MTDSAGFALHRPELRDRLQRGEDKIKALMARTVRRFGAGETLIPANTEHDYVYRVREGWAGRIRHLEDGRSQYILIFLPGDLFAVKSMFVSRHPDAVVTLSNAVLEQIDQRRLMDAYSSDPEIAIRCTWQMLEEERRLHSWVTSLGQGNADERLAMLLIDFRGRLAIATGAGEGLTEYDLPMTQEQLGDHLGISSIHVNRVVKGLREAGIVTIRSKHVTIHDVAALTRLARPLLDIYERSRPEYSTPTD
ncbi:MAG: Crp/Fnr family transcriptional regulator [Alphaproteobacteria bacterium]|nr:MAG: Crp/Fnr family transcriptional regulator [Alphaproteobacteria bacterium]